MSDFVKPYVLIPRNRLGEWDYIVGRVQDHLRDVDPDLALQFGGEALLATNRQQIKTIVLRYAECKVCEPDMLMPRIHILE